MSYVKLFRIKPLVRSMLSLNVRRGYYWHHSKHWDPYYELQRYRDCTVKDFDRRNWFWRWRLFKPQPMAVETNVNGQRMYKIELELADIDAENISVTVKDHIVTVNTKLLIESDGCKQLKQNSYEYTLPSEADVEMIRSELQLNGLLVIEAPLPPLKGEKLHSKKIPVKKE